MPAFTTVLQLVVFSVVGAVIAHSLGPDLSGRY
jgi:hypothetical protein